MVTIGSLDTRQADASLQGTTVFSTITTPALSRTVPASVAGGASQAMHANPAASAALVSDNRCNVLRLKHLIERRQIDSQQGIERLLQARQLPLENGVYFALLIVGSEISRGDIAAQVLQLAD